MVVDTSEQPAVLCYDASCFRQHLSSGTIAWKTEPQDHNIEVTKILRQLFRHTSAKSTIRRIQIRRSHLEHLARKIDAGDSGGARCAQYGLGKSTRTATNV